MNRQKDKAGRPPPARPRVFAALTALVTVLTAAGCSSVREPPGDPYARPGGPATTERDYGLFTRIPRVEPPSVLEVDANVEQALRQLLNQDPEVAPIAQNISICVSKGVTTLTGTVPTQAAQERILEKVKTMPGVDAIVDRLKIQKVR